jgi:hypothetical protein
MLYNYEYEYISLLWNLLYTNPSKNRNIRFDEKSFFYKLLVFYIIVYIEVYFCQSASNINMTVNFTFIFIFFPNIEDKGNFGLVITGIR